MQQREEQNKGAQMEVDFGATLTFHPTELEATFGTMDIFDIIGGFETLNVHIIAKATMPPIHLNALAIFGVTVNVNSKVFVVGISMDIKDLISIGLEIIANPTETLGKTSITLEKHRIRYYDRGSKVDKNYCHGKIT